MALTKNVIAEQIQNNLSFPKKKSVEISESLIKIIKSPLESGNDPMIFHGSGYFAIVIIVCFRNVTVLF